MKFPAQEPRPFSRSSIAQAPDQEGLYGLFRAESDGERFIYIGYGNIRERLEQHLDGIPPEILKEDPEFWVVAYTSAIERTLVELIENLQPLYHDSSELLRPSPRSPNGQ
ncbi:MAG: hypothetical protein R3300_20480 [Candidatus Promineifilaceae bacterium]|nr:hypothetical protein [Candidatus Promineifilaceae bacterium]